MKKKLCVILTVVMVMSLFSTVALATDNFTATLQTSSVKKVVTSGVKQNNTGNLAKMGYSVTRGVSTETNLYRLWRNDDGASCTGDLWAKPGTYTLGKGGTNIKPGYSFYLNMRANTNHELPKNGSRSSIDVSGWLNVDP